MNTEVVHLFYQSAQMQMNQRGYKASMPQIFGMEEAVEQLVGNSANTLVNGLTMCVDSHIDFENLRL